MVQPIQDILQESSDYYRRLKTELVGRLMINEKGQVKRKMLGGGVYFYLKKYQGGKIVEYYLDSKKSPLVERIAEEIETRRRSIDDLRKAKDALKRLGFSRKEIFMEDLSDVIKNLVREFDKAGLWEEGLELVGSWCFKVYQVHCGVEYFPLRTLDVDIAIPTPYKGSAVDVTALLRELGFEEVHNYADGSTFYKNADFVVEMLSNKKGNREEKDISHSRDLNVAPVAVRYLDILLANPFVIKARDLGAVRLPSMPAFFLHKMLVADVRRNKEKQAKDYQQAEAVAKVIARDPALIEETRRIGEGLHKKWLQKILASAGKQGGGVIEGLLASAGWK